LEPLDSKKSANYISPKFQEASAAEEEGRRRRRRRRG